jgi:hypothetical protein
LKFAFCFRWGWDGIDLLQLDKFVLLQYFLPKARLFQAYIGYFQERNIKIKEDSKFTNINQIPRRFKKELRNDIAFKFSWRMCTSGCVDFFILASLLLQ